MYTYTLFLRFTVANNCLLITPMHVRVNLIRLHASAGVCSLLLGNPKFNLDTGHIGDHKVARVGRLTIDNSQRRLELIDLSLKVTIAVFSFKWLQTYGFSVFVVPQALIQKI